MINISVDGGGTKLSVIAFDENLDLLASARGSGVNSLFLDEELVRESIEKTVAELFSGVKKAVGTVKEIDNLYITMTGHADILSKEIASFAEVRKTSWLGEGELGIFAGTLGGDGLTALAGTGSDCFLNEGGRTVSQIGGWGIYFGDEGSGFYIGRQAIIAAIKSHDGRGEKTELEDLVFAQLGLKQSLWELCAIHRRPTFRVDVASLTRAVETAYKNGDGEAKKIIEQAAVEIASAATTLLLKSGRTEDSDVIYTTSGGAWKTAEYMTEVFTAKMAENFPKARFIKPEFEPVIGGAVYYLYENSLPAERIALRSKFGGFLL